MKKLLQSLIIVVLFCSSIASAQQEVRNKYEFISPVPGSDFNTLESNIIIREGTYVDFTTLGKDAIVVIGSKSGKIEGEIILSDDQKTIIFEPFQNFEPSEKINVKISPGIETRNGQQLEEVEFSFRVAPFEKTPNPYEYIEELKPNYNDTRKVKNVNNTTGDFPSINVEMYDSSALGDGKIFLAVASDVENIGYYLMILNNDGSPYWSKELQDDYAYDFKVQPNGYMTYAQFLEHHSYTGGGNVIHKVMDHSFSVIDSVQMGNGYVAEAHDFQILPNGHYLLFGYYLTEVDMTQYVEGGHPNALVSGGIVQELDSDKNVIFQWRSWDYYDFDTYEWGRRTSRPIVSEFHLNTINLDKDGNIILATPRWTKKINRQTGDIMWNMGGFDNEFTFTGYSEDDGADLANGHMIHRLENDNFLVYDNGSRRDGSSSQVHEIYIDEENKSVDFVWSYVPDSTINGWHRGNAHRLENGNTVIGWGGSSGKYSPAFTEVNGDGEVLMELFFDPYDIESYRAFRLPVPKIEPDYEVVETEVAPGNTYDFIDPEKGTTGISIKVNSIEGSGYNELQVDKYNYSPLNPSFPQKPPLVIPARIEVSTFGLTSINYDVMFDINEWKVNNPEEAVIYHREFPNSGLIIPLATSYNHVTGKLIATTSKLGEFIVAEPDFDVMVFTPQPRTPINGNNKINYTLPVKLEWSPIGYYQTFNLEVASDSLFNNVIISESDMQETYYDYSSLENNSTYYWRVKTINEAGESDWSDALSFTTTDPFIELLNPNGGESIQIGLEYFIEWDDNIDEDVVLTLLENESIVRVIDTTESRTAYQWEVPLDLDLSSSYKLKLSSLEDSELLDISDNTFSLSDTTTAVEDDNGLPTDYLLFQNFPNPFNPSTEIEYSLPISGDVRLTVYDVLGNEIGKLVDDSKNSGTHSVAFNAHNLSSGIYFYELVVDGKLISTKKMILVK